MNPWTVQPTNATTVTNVGISTGMSIDFASTSVMATSPATNVMTTT